MPIDWRTNRAGAPKSLTKNHNNFPSPTHKRTNPTLPYIEMTKIKQISSESHKGERERESFYHNQTLQTSRDTERERERDGLTLKMRLLLVDFHAKPPLKSIVQTNTKTSPEIPSACTTKVNGTAGTPKAIASLPRLSLSSFS
jgi:hypothetical protein